MSTKPRLTKAQKKLLDELIAENAPEGNVIECLPEEWRSAEALARKGYLEIPGGRHLSGYFEVQLKLNVR